MSFYGHRLLGSSEVITSGLINFTFPFTTSPPREGRKALQGHAARTRDARPGFPRRLGPSSVPPASWRLRAGPGGGGGGKARERASLIEMLAARLVGSRHLAVRCAVRGRAWGAGCGEDRRRPRATWEQAGRPSPREPRAACLPVMSSRGRGELPPLLTRQPRGTKGNGSFFSSVPDSSLEELIYSSVCSLKDIIYWLIVVITKC